MTEVKKRLVVHVDVETLGLTGKCVVTQLAALGVDMDDPEAERREVEEYLPIQPQITLGRIMDASTILYWLGPKVSEEARLRFQRSSGNDMDELTALVQSYHSKVSRLIESASYYEVWARGPQFDIVIIESLFNDLGLEAPWAYDRIFDLRTTMNLAGIDKREITPRAGLIEHVALHDCKFQQDCYEEAMRRLRAKV